MDPTTITSVVTAGTQVLSLLKAAAEAFKAAGKPEAVGDVVQAQLAMMDLLQRQNALIDENRGLRDRVAELEATLQTKGELVFHYNCYWRDGGSGVLEGPYSAMHWDLDRRLVRMRRYGRDTYDDGEKIHFFEPKTSDRAFVPLTFLREHKVPVLDEERDR